MSRTGKWAKRAVWATFVGAMCIGCNPLQTVAFIFHKDDKVPAQFPLRPKEGPKHDKDEEIKVLVICGQHQSGGVPLEFAQLDRDVAGAIAKRMPEEAKDNKEKITVISPSQLDKYKIKNPNWNRDSAAKVGKALGADYVIDVTLSKVQVYQPGSRNMIYEGRAELWVDVYDVAATETEPKYKYAHQFAYQPNHNPDATEVNINLFKQGFVERLASEVVWKHLDHRPADGIAAGR